MNDIYMEYLVKHKKDTKATVATVAIYVGASLLTIAMLMLILAFAIAGAGTGISELAFSVGFVLIAFMWYFAFFFAQKFNIEYEYILTNSEMDIDKIMSKSQRKRIITFDFAEAEICANIKDDAHNDAYKRQNDNRRVLDLTGDKDNGGVYFVDFFADGEKTRVLFQPTSKMAEAIRKFNPRNIFVYEDRF